MPRVAKPFEYWVKTEDRGYISPCWIWTGRLTDDGYGMYWINSKKGYLTHRYRYERKYGKIPSGMEIDHHCTRVGEDNRIYCRACCNPEHLEIVTHTENNHRGNSAKITMEDAERIRRWYIGGGVSQRFIAKRFGVHQKTVCDVINNKRWNSA